MPISCETQVRRLELENRKMKMTIMNLEEELELGNSCDCSHVTSLEARAISSNDQNQINPLHALLEADKVWIYQLSRNTLTHFNFFLNKSSNP